MIYFIHNEANRTIKIGHGWDPRKRLSTFQISTPNKLVLLGKIGGTKWTEKKVHELVWRHCGLKPGESDTRPLCVNGEWFDDRILPFVMELISSPKTYLGDDKKPVRPVVKDASLHQCKLVLAFDSGERYQESFILREASPDVALAALGNIAHARLSFLANTVQITTLAVPGRPTKKVSLRGAFVTQKCLPKEGLSVIFNSDVGGGCMTLYGIKQYSNRWLHGVPDELCQEDPYCIRPNAQFQALLYQFAQALNRSQCVVTAQTPLAVKALIPRGIGLLPKGELRSKVNKKAASKRKPQRLPGQPDRVLDGIVYFVQDTITMEIKIGFCLRKPEKRMADLQVGTSNVLRLFGHVAGSSLHEKLLHKRFSQFRLQGEWFSTDIIEAIQTIMKCASIKEWLEVQDLAPLQQNELSAVVEPVDPS